MTSRPKKVVAVAYIDPWERQPNEPVAEFSAFSAYLKSRTYGHAAKVAKTDLATIEGYAKDYAWERRALAFDEDRNRDRRVAIVAALDEMATRQAGTGTLLQKNGMDRIRQMSDAEIARMPTKLALRFVEQGVRIERAARGLAPEPSVAVSVNVTQGQVQYGTAAPIAQFLRENPDKVGPVVDLLEQLQSATRTVVVEGKSDGS